MLKRLEQRANENMLLPFSHYWYYISNQPSKIHRFTAITISLKVIVKKLLLISYMPKFAFNNVLSAMYLHKHKNHIYCQICLNNVKFSFYLAAAQLTYIATLRA